MSHCIATWFVGLEYVTSCWKIVVDMIDFYFDIIA